MLPEANAQRSLREFTPRSLESKPTVHIVTSQGPLTGYRRRSPAAMDRHRHNQSAHFENQDYGIWTLTQHAQTAATPMKGTGDTLADFSLIDRPAESRAYSPR